MPIPEPTTPSPVTPADAAWRVARFRFAVGETQSSRVLINGAYALRALRWPSAGLTASTFRVLVGTGLEGTLLELADALGTAAWTITASPGRHTALPTSLGVGAGPVLALVGDVAQAGAEAVVEGILVPA